MSLQLFQEDILLENDRVLLRRRNAADFEATKRIALDERIWKWYPILLNTEEKLQNHFEDAEKLFVAKQKYTFAIIDKRDGQMAGSTSYQYYSAIHRRVEIGWTWLGVDYQGTGLNKACKALLLNYAFEKLDLMRVELKADVLNLPSVKAMEKIGAIREGVLRSRMQMYGDRRRDSVYYSILREEWPKVKEERFGEFY